MMEPPRWVRRVYSSGDARLNDEGAQQLWVEGVFT